MADERYEQRQRNPESDQRSRQNSIFGDASGMERDEGRRSFARSEARTGSWFGHEDDDAGDDQGEDGHYRRWRDRQIEQLDRDYDEYRRERQQQFQSDFDRSEEHTSELQSLMRISYAVFCLNNKNKQANRNKMSD